MATPCLKASPLFRVSSASSVNSGSGVINREKPQTRQTTTLRDTRNTWIVNIPEAAEMDNDLSRVFRQTA